MVPNTDKLLFVRDIFLANIYGYTRFCKIYRFRCNINVLENKKWIVTGIQDPEVELKNPGIRVGVGVAKSINTGIRIVTVTCVCLLLRSAIYTLPWLVILPDTNILPFSGLVLKYDKQWHKQKLYEGKSVTYELCNSNEIFTFGAATLHLGNWTMVNPWAQLMANWEICISNLCRPPLCPTATKNHEYGWQ